MNRNPNLSWFLVGLALMMVLLVPAMAADAPAVSPYGVGFRGDGTGVFADAKPPLRWSDTENVALEDQTPQLGIRPSCACGRQGVLHDRAVPARLLAATQLL